MLVTDLVNVRYLSGFTGSNAALLILAEDATPVLATDGRYRTQAAQQSPDAEVVIERACGSHLAGRAASFGALRLGFESHVVTVDAFAAMKKASGDTVDWSVRPAPWRPCARSRTPARSPCCGWPARPPMRP